MKFNKTQPFINYCWRFGPFGFDWNLLRNGLSNRRSHGHIYALSRVYRY